MEIDKNKIYTIYVSYGDSTSSYKVRGEDMTENEVVIVLGYMKNGIDNGQ